MRIIISNERFLNVGNYRCPGRFNGGHPSLVKGSPGYWKPQSPDPTCSYATLPLIDPATPPASDARASA